VSALDCDLVRASRRDRYNETLWGRGRVHLSLAQGYVSEGGHGPQSR